MLTRKGTALLLVLAIILTGWMPRTAGAADVVQSDTVVSLTNTAGTADSISSPQAAEESAIVQSYPMPSIYTPSQVYSLKAGNEAVPVIEYLPEYDYAEFSFSGTVSIEVTADEPITSYSISPLAKNIQGTIDGNKLTFTLSSSTYVIVDINEVPGEKADESDPAKIRKRLVIAADPLETDIPAASGPGIYNVTAAPYLADNTGATMASDAIQQAIDDAHQAGGGTVYIPAGVYLSGNLTLKSNVTFYLAGGAVIVGTGRGEDYRNDFRKDSISDGTYFIRTEVNSENITMRGRGTIDGKGIEMRKRKMTNPPSTHKAGEGFINNLVVPMATSHFTFDGLILRDGGFWAFLVVRSDNVTITNYKGFQNLRVLEDDAIDINESQNVLVKHAIAISDDDTFSTKTWPQKGMSKDWPGAIENLVNVVFDDCLAWTRAAAFKMGMGICVPQIGVVFRNSYVYQSARALLVDHAYTENPLPVEGWAKDITFENIDIERVGINQFGNYWLRVSTSTAGDVSNVLLKNINVRATGGESPIQGNPVRGGMVNGVTFTDIYVRGTLAKSLSDMKVAVKNENVSGLVIANSTPALFSDNFEDGDTEGWTSVAGGWTVADDASNVDAPNKALSSWNQTKTSLLTANAGASWADYAYEAKVKLPFINGEENAGLLFRVQDENNFYMYRMNAKSKKMELYKSVAGTMTLVADTPFTSAKQWYTVKAVVHGNTVKGYVDGELKTEWTNPAAELTAGGIGFRTTSAKVLFDDARVSAINEAPTDIVLSHDSIAENTTAGGIVGTFSTVDPDEQDTSAYALVEGEGDTDNGSFSIAALGNTLMVRSEPDYETKDSYSIRVRTTDSGGLYYERSFTIHILDRDETPVDSDPDAVLFSDDFEDGNTAGWTSSGGTWNVATDVTKALVQKSSTTAFIATGDSWTDYVFEAQVKVPITNANAGIVFRATDNKNFYMYRINASNQKLELYKCVEGTMTLVSSTSFTAAAKQWYTLKAIVQGNTIKGYADGERKIEWTNPVNELTAGKIGFRTTSADAMFDQVLVTGIAQTQSEPHKADESKNTVTLDRSSAAIGQTVVLTAEGDRQSADGAVAGDEKFVPTNWTSSETGKSGSFAWNEEKSAYTSGYTVSEAGAHTVTATFQKQSWTESAWVNETTATRSVTLTVYAPGDVKENLLGVSPSQLVLGQTAVLSAEGYHQNMEPSVIGEERYYPIAWSSTEAGKSGEFSVAGVVYQADYTPAEAGSFTITATYRNQVWDGTSWNDTDLTDTKAVNLTVVAQPTGDGDGDGNGEGDVDTPPSPAPGTTGTGTPAATPLDIGQATTAQEGGRTVTTILIDPVKWEQKLVQGGMGATIAIPVNAPSDKTVVELSGLSVKAMEAKEAVLQIRTEKATYTLTAAQIDMDAISRQLGAQAALQDIKVGITIAKPADEVVRQMQDIAGEKGYRIVAQPIEFKITASSGSNALEVSSFKGYVERTLLLEGGTDPGRMATGIVFNEDGSFSPVPTQTVVVDGKVYAKINSLTNSIYSAVYASKSFTDIASHWAKDAIDDLGARLVVDGDGNGRFEPDRAMTRAEFAAILIKGLGIARPGAGTDIFNDVTGDSWYYDAIAQAHAYGIIDGYGNGAFGPSDTITREQAITMTAKAMQITGLKAEPAKDEADLLLAGFDDAGDVSDYAKAGIASCLKAGIISGRNEAILAPKASITRAEVAVIVQRLLRQSGLI